MISSILRDRLCIALLAGSAVFGLTACGSTDGFDDGQVDDTDQEPAVPESEPGSGEPGNVEPIGTAEQALGWLKLATVGVKNSPLPGQGWRCSQNFMLNPPGQPSMLKWVIVTPQATNATFSVALDIPWGSDPTILANLSNETVTEVHEGNNLYIGGVGGASAPFTVVVYGGY
jgi:hypothetical protein